MNSMRTIFPTHCSPWPFLLVIWIVGWFWVPQPVRADTPSQQAVTSLQLPDNTVLEFTSTGITRKRLSSEIQEEAVIWSIAAKNPLLPLLFENREGEPLLFYFVSETYHSGEFHAVRIEDGQEQWSQPVWSHVADDNPVSPVFLPPWIYIGHGLWLEQIDPDDGRIIERYLARTHIQSLRLLPEGGLEIQAEEYGDIHPILTFHNGRFHPHIAAPGNLLLSLGLWKRAHWVVEEFDSGYWELYRPKRSTDPPLSPTMALRYREFDLQKTEEAYWKAYQADPTNPAFALYLALTLYYQQRYAEAETYKQEALVKSEPFWEVSLQLGGFICEALQLTEWADEFYAQGIRRYFQDVPAPQEWAVLIDVLIHMGGQRNAAGGPFDRAMHVLELRRQLFPYTEFENHFSREYARILRQKGQYQQAELETQRIGKLEYFNDFLTPTPFSFTGFFIMSILVGGLLVLSNETRYWHEWPIVLATIGGLGIVIGHAGMFSDSKRIVLLPLLLTGYIGILAFSRRRKASTPLSQRRIMLDLALSSYLVLMTTLHVAYLLGKLLSGSPSGGKIGELVCIGLWSAVCRWRQRKSAAPSFRYVRTVLIVWALIWSYLAWVHQYIGMIEAQAATPLPSYYYGHPNWKAFIDPEIQNAKYDAPDLSFMQAVVHHLGEDHEFARRAYQSMAYDARALNNLGVMSVQTDQDQARRYFEQALEQDSECAPALYNLGVLTDDTTLIEQAKLRDSWRVNAYQTYAPDKPWIASPSLHEWSTAIYWSQGGFPVRGFTEIVVAVKAQWFHVFW